MLKSPRQAPAPHPARTVMRFGPGGPLRVAQPAETLVIGPGESERLANLADLLTDWFDRGIQLACGALSYDAGAFLHGLEPGTAGPGPLAVVHGYREGSADTAVDDSGDWRLTDDFRPRQSAAAHRDSVAAIRDYLRAGDCYQVNLAQALEARYQGDPLAGFERLLARHPAPFGGYLEWDGGALLSASPERFLSIRHGHVVTDPIKGSRPRGATPDEDQRLAAALLDSAKDRAENLMIVDLLRNDLGRVCRPGSIKVEELCGLHRFSNVQHLVSRVSGDLRDGVRPLDALLACFPGGSITGAPKKRAMEIIAELEPVPRGFYCGSMFWQTADGDFDSNILIRTLQARADGTLLCHGGGGIVVDSDPAEEYEESLFKVRGLMEAVAG